MGGSVEATCDITLLLRNMCHQRKKRCVETLIKLKITLATDRCSEGDFDRRGVLTYPSFISFPNIDYLISLSSQPNALAPSTAASESFNSEASNLVLPL